jgi:hypothetical protein
VCKSKQLACNSGFPGVLSEIVHPPPILMQTTDPSGPLPVKKIHSKEKRSFRNQPTTLETFSVVDQKKFSPTWNGTLVPCAQW